MGGNNGVEIQLYATWIFYAVLNDLCSSVAVELGQPKERISIDMVFRGLYHFSRAVLRGKATDVVTYLAQNYKILGSIKRNFPALKAVPFEGFQSSVSRKNISATAFYPKHPG